MKNLTVLVLLLSAASWAQDWRAMREEVDRTLPPWIQYYNRLKGQPKLSPWQQDEPESLNVRLVGKWGRGPAARVTGKDTLVYLALGSEVAIFNAADGHNPRIIAEVQCRFVVDNVILRDTVLYAVLQGGVEVFNVANPRSVTRIRYLEISAVDMCIKDSMAYTIDADSFKAYRIVSPESLERLGACADSGYYIAADSGFAYACDRWGLYVIDATNPRSPHQVTILTTAQSGAAWVEGGLCYYTELSASPEAFCVADVSDPYHPAGVGRLSGAASYDLYRLGYFVYLPNYDIIDVSTPSQPAVVGSATPGGNGVWTRSPFSYSFVALTNEGLGAVNISDPVHPVMDTMLAGADAAYGIDVRGNYGYVADWRAGMKDLSLATAVMPVQIGSYDTAGEAPDAYAVEAKDSFAYLITQWYGPTAFRTIDISDPASPVLVATHYMGVGYGIVLRDTLAFLAENYKLEIFSIADPRNPRLVGSCATSHAGTTLWLTDTLAYANECIFNIKNPANPFIVGTFGVWPFGNCVKDTFAYLAVNFHGLEIWSVADPSAPYLIDSVHVDRGGYDVLVVDSLLYFGGVDLQVFKLDNPSHPTEIGHYATPGPPYRLFYSAPYIYAACFDAGVCILETTPTTGVAESQPGMTPLGKDGFRVAASPNPVQHELELTFTPTEIRTVVVKIADVTGRKLIEVRLPVAGGKARLVLPGGRMPSGVYFITARCSTTETTIKVVKQ